MPSFCFSNHGRIHVILEYHPGIAWVLFTGGKKFGKTHPTWLTPTVRRIQRCIICPDRCCFQRGVREQRLTEILLHRYTRVSPRHCLGFIHRGQKIRENASNVVDPHGKTNPTVYHMSRSVQSPGRSLVSKLTEILLHRYTRVSPSQCLGFIARWQKNWENAPHAPDLHDHTNPTVHHLSRSGQSLGRSFISKVKTDSFL